MDKSNVQFEALLCFSFGDKEGFNFIVTLKLNSVVSCHAIKFC